MADGARSGYARRGDGQVAYQLEAGEGPVVAVLLGSMAGSVLAVEPLFVAAHDRWRRFSRLLWIDARGTGKSDQAPTDAPASVDDAAADVVAVLDDIGIERAWLHGFHGGAGVAIALTAAHPERVEGLLLVNGWARLVRADDVPWGISQRFSDSVIASHGEQFGTGMFADIAVPSRMGDPEVKQLFVRIEGSSSRSQAIVLTRMIQELDVRDRLAAINVPTIVVHTRGNQMFPVEHGRYLAAHIPGALYAEVEGTDHVYQLQTYDDVMDELEAFVTGVRPLPHADRVFAAVLFTDIVGSTERATTAGDRAWRDKLDRHDQITAEVVGRHGGRVVKSTGDGALATFDVPSRSLRAALELLARLAEHDIPTRAGVHAGEVERRRDDVSGVAVHIAARVGALAGTGELLVSRSVPDLVLGQPFTFTDAGEHTLKGAPGTWQLFSVAAP
ncbi:MAG: hypothetical protein QOE63_1948 [Acidimicrobiaceae bacterium]